MIRRPLALSPLLAVTLVGMASACKPQTDPVYADLVLLNGNVLTVDDEQQGARAVAIRGREILAVGSDAEIRRYISSNTEEIELGGKTVIPGLIEGHGHYMSLGESLAGLDVRASASWDVIVQQVADAVTKATPGQWIVGRGWHQDRWQTPPNPSVEGLPTHAALSQVSPQNPVLLIHTSGHAVFVNAMGLAAAGITLQTPDPVGGEIVRDTTGAPTGMLREAAQDAARAALAHHRAQRPPAEIETEAREHVALAANNALAHGITSFQDMGSTFPTIDLLKRMAGEGNLPVRLYLAIESTSDIMADKLAAYRMVDYGDEFLTVRTIGENVMDGALGTHGGWLLEPYTDMPRTSGLVVTSVAEIRKQAELAVAHDYQLAIQGIGDRATRELLAIYEQAFASHPNKTDWRWRIEHAQVIHPDDLPRFAQLGIIPSVQGVFACSDGPWVVDRLGPKRAKTRGYLFRSLLESGAVVTNGTDPPVEDIDPIASFACSVTRKLPDGSAFFPEQALTRAQALRSYTLSNAYAAFEEQRKGSLTPGKLADIAILSQDLLTVGDDALANTTVLGTIVDGKLVYEHADLR